MSYTYTRAESSRRFVNARLYTALALVTLTTRNHIRNDILIILYIIIIRLPERSRR